MRTLFYDIQSGDNLLELIMHRYERASTILTSNRPVDDWGKLLGDTAAVTALLDRPLHHAHIVKCSIESGMLYSDEDIRRLQGSFFEDVRNNVSSEALSIPIVSAVALEDCN